MFLPNPHIIVYKFHDTMKITLSWYSINGSLFVSSSLVDGTIHNGLPTIDTMACPSSTHNDARDWWCVGMLDTDIGLLVGSAHIIVSERVSLMHHDQQLPRDRC